MICFPATPATTSTAMTTHQSFRTASPMIVGLTPALTTTFGSFPRCLYYGVGKLVAICGHTPHARQKSTGSLGLLAPTGPSALGIVSMNAKEEKGTVAMHETQTRVVDELTNSDGPTLAKLMTLAERELGAFIAR